MSARKLDERLQAWADSLRLTNALYSLYKTYRDRTDGLESQVTEMIKTEPLSDKDWSGLRKRVEEA